ncbi:MAG: TIGR03619 family F420-dependent LLM class oxidoreductase [Thaumarchaeota archaeon]|nr:TIGR03619 family F420-dependent LLM class oxidoreductase [Nitrososphaerota archaeon]
MKFGVAVPNYGENLSVDGMLTVAKTAEEFGFDSVWTTDHILMPKASGTPYERIFESISSLAFLAASTNRVQLGVSALIVALRNPVIAAKQLATIDALSGGRLLFAVGVGWNPKEFSNLGSDFGDRGARVDESIRLMRELFEGITTFNGQRTGIEFKDAVFDPRPSHRVPIWIGGTSPAAMKRAATIGDAWHPNISPLEDFRRQVASFRGVTGGSEKPIHVRIGLNPTSTTTEYVGAQGDRRLQFCGDREANRIILNTLEELRVEGIVVATNPTGKASIEDQVEGLKLVRNQLMLSRSTSDSSPRPVK